MKADTKMEADNHLMLEAHPQYSADLGLDGHTLLIFGGWDIACLVLLHSLVHILRQEHQ